MPDASIRRSVAPVLARTLVVAASLYAAGLSTAYFCHLVPRHCAESAWILVAAAAIPAFVLSRGECGDAAPVSVSQSTHTIAACFGVAFVAVANYAGSFPLGLLSDDFVLWKRAAAWDAVSDGWFFRPLPIVVWALIGKASGGAASLHLVNIALHGLNAALVVILGRRLGFSTTVAAFAGAVFACLPVSVETVAWASGIQDILATNLGLGFVLATSFVRPRGPVTALSAALLVGALASKETAVVFPALAFVVWFGRAERWNGWAVTLGAVISAVFAAWRVFGVGAASTIAVRPSPYFAKQLLVGAFGSLAVPFTRAELNAVPALGIGAAVLVAALVAYDAWSARGDETRRSMRLAAWAIIPVLPVWSMFYVSEELQGSRYLYLPAVGWALLVAALAAGAARLCTWRAFRVAAAAALIVTYSVGIYWHMADWHRAARTRDAVLASAAATVGASPCSTVAFLEVPDSVGGAYIFRNGFIEALGDLGKRSSVSGDKTTPTAACSVRWNGQAFQPGH